VVFFILYLGHLISKIWVWAEHVARKGEFFALYMYIKTDSATHSCYDKACQNL
jgi:hypothetical protein